MLALKQRALAGLREATKKRRSRTLLSELLVAVQPMSGPTATVFYLDFIHDSKKASATGPLESSWPPRRFL